MAAEVNLTKMESLGEIKSIDFVNRFSTNINELLKLLGVTRKMPLTQDLLIKFYDWETTLENGDVAEGETIPLSIAKRVPLDTQQIAFKKYRRAVSAEAIARHGADLAINQADEKIMRQIQNLLKNDFVEYLAKSPTKVSATSLQEALAQSWGQLNTFNEFEGAQFVSFVNPLDVASYLGSTPVTSNGSNVFGMTLLQNFLGASNVVVLNGIPQGKVYSTAVENLVLAYLDMRASDLGGIFADFTDETGLISATRGRQLSNATYESLFMNALVLFAEIPSGVVEATISGGSTTTQPTTTTTTTQNS
ncbi:hypothetical protein ACYRFT_12920 [Listeria kieliensis]